MPFRFKELKATVNPGSSAEVQWVVPAEESYTLRKIQAVEETGADLRKVTVALTIDGVSRFKEGVTLHIFNVNLSDSPVLDFPAPGGTAIRFTLRNDDTSAKTVRIVLYLEEAGK
ncbi:MAG: hypothetical protein QXO02_08595 [Thermofilaceae archaeon]